MHLKMLPAKWRRFCLGLNVLSRNVINYHVNCFIITGGTEGCWFDCFQCIQWWKAEGSQHFGVCYSVNQTKKQGMSLHTPNKNLEAKFFSLWTHRAVHAHWGWMMHICNRKLGTASGNGLSSIQWQAIIWTKATFSLSGLLGTNFDKI